MKNKPRYKFYSIFFILTALFCNAAFAQAGIDRIKLLNAAKKSNITLSWDTLTGSGLLEKNGHQLSFRIGESLVLLDYHRLALTDAPVNDSGTLFVSQAFLNIAEELFAETKPLNEFYRIDAILIDAGHGGKDPGASGTHAINGKATTVVEKDITLRVSKLLHERLKAAYPEKKILLTRNDDRFLELSQRTNIANSVEVGEHGAILFVSIHANAVLNKNAAGFEVWYLSPGYRRKVLNTDNVDDAELFTIFNDMAEEEYTRESMRIAKFIMDGLTAQIGKQSPSRGIRAAEWFVVRNVNMPSVLIELGFVSNPAEAALLASDAYLRKLAEGIYTGLHDFINDFEKMR